ncbi:helix-turn-helix domain-containing protein [Allofustis seminis]|uniref:helix-turn-helix domain-containing protein n=1 Tax=Allofustis seminis TaxID=166939 RepID=UPI0003754515|nr:helix-turn-helix transcriptional regulator [Allofustis seminis]
MTKFKIKELRENKKMTQDELSDKSGVSRATISSLENNDTKVSNTSTLVKLARALDVNVKDLFF